MYKDPNKQREFQRKWIAKRRAEFFKGKKCLLCGSKTNLIMSQPYRNKKSGSHTVLSYAKEHWQKYDVMVTCAKCRGWRWAPGRSLSQRQAELEVARSSPLLLEAKKKYGRR